MSVEHPHHNVVAAVIERDGRYLCVQRGKTRFEYTSYRYEFPGGKVEQGETDEQAVRRELMEEMGVDVRVIAPVGSISHVYPDFSVTLRFYLCQLVSGIPVLREHVASVWAAPDELESLPWVEADRAFVQQLARQ